MLTDKLAAVEDVKSLRKELAKEVKQLREEFREELERVQVANATAVPVIAATASVAKSEEKKLDIHLGVTRAVGMKAPSTGNPLRATTVSSLKQWPERTDGRKQLWP